MKTATITWITYNNFGTLLQAYALQKFVEQLGHENEIVSDRIILEEYKKKNSPKKALPSLKREREKIESRIIHLLMNPQRLGRIMTARFNKEAFEYPFYGVQEKCEEFKKSDLKIREDISSESLPLLNKEFDAFICGSDQIWSVFDSIFNPYYYLDFAYKRKIAYAPSLGTDRISEKTATTIKKLLSDFYAISVRERVSAEQLRALTGKNVEWVCDPTLLHDSEFWSAFSANVKVPKGRYLLCYFLENQKWYFEYAKKLANELHLKIKLIPNKWDYLSNENVLKYGVGPKEFVSLFRNAEYVLTDSYHGSIFSLLFQRDFLYLQRFKNDDPNSQNIRVDSLFSYLDIADRMIADKTEQVSQLSIQNYDRISQQMREFREKSAIYLSNCLYM